jgi:hypothetical protein
MPVLSFSLHFSFLLKKIKYNKWLTKAARTRLLGLQEGWNEATFWYYWDHITNKDTGIEFGEMLKIFRDYKIRNLNHG